MAPAAVATGGQTGGMGSLAKPKIVPSRIWERARAGIRTLAELPQLEAYRARMGWTLPIASSRGTSFSADCGAGGGFLLSVFLRNGTGVYRTYSTTQRGVDRLLFRHSILDLCAYGRQEDWEDSPAGWPQHPTYG